MSYAIGNVVLGVDLSNDLYTKKTDPWKDHRDELFDVHNDGVPGFDGSGESDWFGISLGEFDECNNLTGQKMIQLCTATPEQIIQYTKMTDELYESDLVSKELREKLARYEPQVLILWGSS